MRFSMGKQQKQDVAHGAERATAEAIDRMESATVSTAITMSQEAVLADVTHGTLSAPEPMSNDNQFDDSPVRTNACLEWATKGDRSMILIGILLVVFLNFWLGRLVFYPFAIFATWVHEMCHGLAILMIGGEIEKLQIFGDGSGSFQFEFPDDVTLHQAAFVVSAGYPGTAIFGALLLLCRKTVYGPLAGIVFLGITLIVSCLLYVRNVFGTSMLFGEGIFLLLAAILLCSTPNRRTWLYHLYNVLSLTMCLNAVASIAGLFGEDQVGPDGEPVPTDAHVVALLWGGHHKLWALAWLFLSLACTALGIWLAPDTRKTRDRRYNGSAGGGRLHGMSPNGNNTTLDVNVVPSESAVPFEADRV